LRSLADGFLALEGAAALDHELLPALGADEPDAVHDAVLETVCRSLGFDAGAFWLVDRRAEILRCIRFWARPETPTPSLERASMEMVFRYGVGMVGTVWRSGAPMWICDVGQEPGFFRPEIAKEDGIASVLAIPVAAAGDVVAVIQVFSRAEREESPAVLASLPSLVEPLSPYVQRLQAEEQLRFQGALLESQSEATIDGILVVAPDGTMLWSNGRFAEMWGIPDDVIATRSDDAAIGYVLDQLVNPDAFVDRIQYLYAHPDEDSRDELELADGRCFDRFSTALRRPDGTLYGRAWYFRDVTRHKSAEATLRAAGERAHLLAEASAVLASSLDAAETLHLVADVCVPRLADWCCVHVLDPDGTLVPAAVSGGGLRRADSERLVELMRSGPALRVTDDTEVSAAVRGGRGAIFPVIDDDVLRGARDRSEAREVLLAMGFVSGLIVPIRARRRVLGAMSLAMAASGRRYTEGDLAVATDLASRAGLAIDNARLHSARLADVAALQQTLVPPAVPDPTPLEAATVYLAGAEGVDVGGDFYDLFAVGDGSWAFLLGDVCGRGVESAAVSSLVRHSVRVLSERIAEPADLVTELNRILLRHGDPERFCTLVYGKVAAVDGGASVVFANGGHPSPMLVRPSGQVRTLACRGTLLGLLPEATVSERSVTLRAGESLVCITDGVVDARHAGVSFGERRLFRVLRSAAGRPAREIAGAVETALRSWSSERLGDDVAALVIHCPREA
jgi:serine phosphatase RsbU (regulator of sigma subunit)/PAS domain-containing protein